MRPSSIWLQMKSNPEVRAYLECPADHPQPGTHRRSCHQHRRGRNFLGQRRRRAAWRSALPVLTPPAPRVGKGGTAAALSSPGAPAALRDWRGVAHPSNSSTSQHRVPHPSRPILARGWALEAVDRSRSMSIRPVSGGLVHQPVETLARPPCPQQQADKDGAPRTIRYS